MDVAAITRDRLAAQSQRATPARIRLAEAVAESSHPVTITEILSREPTFALSSTYRNLTVLEHAGILHRIVTNDDIVRYELAEPFAGHHHHLMCEGCGAVIDVPLTDLEQALHRAAAMVAETHGFRTTAHRVDLIGRCANCT